MASNSAVYSFRGIRAYDELQTVVTEVGQVKQTVTLVCIIIQGVRARVIQKYTLMF